MLSKKTFIDELSVCKKLSQENNQKCAWGECSKCGVIPLLHKLHTGKLLEDPKKIKKIKDKLFKI